MMKKQKMTLTDIVVEKYHGVILFGVVVLAVAVWLYEYHYTVSGDDLLGMISAGLLFFGTLVVGTGIRGWRDGEDFRNRYVHMRSKTGAEVAIRKRKQKWSR